jgi:hypothetical protein
MTTPEPPCDCEEHRNWAALGQPAATQYGSHVYTLESGDHMGGWRWVCSCGRRGKWTYQSPSAAYHLWEQHVVKVMG